MSSANLLFPNDLYTCESAVLGMKNSYIKEEASAKDELLQHLAAAAAAGDSVAATIDGPPGLLHEITNLKVDVSGRTDTHFMKYFVRDGKYVKVWECGICGKDFGHQYTLLRHLPTHTDERKYQCTTCGKAFRQMSTLCQHKAIHSVERPYTCDVCHKSFNRVSTLMSHKKTHSGHKPHKCAYCHKAFHQKGNLRNHVFTHTNERPYKCDVCAKGFNQMSNLMCHKLKAHAGVDRPRYKCPHCDRAFAKRIAFRNHELYEHRIASAAGDGGGEPALASPEPAPALPEDDGVLVEPIDTEHMQRTLQRQQTPFALLIPVAGMPAIVRVRPVGDKHLLLAVTWEELRRQANISVLEAGAAGGGEGAKLQVKIPIVATLREVVSGDQTLCMEVFNPGPGTDPPRVIYPVAARATDAPPCTFFQDTATKAYNLRQLTEELALMAGTTDADVRPLDLHFDDAFVAESFALATDEMGLLGRSLVTPVTDAGECVLNADGVQLTDLNAGTQLEQAVLALD